MEDRLGGTYIKETDIEDRYDGMMKDRNRPKLKNQNNLYTVEE